MNEGELFTLNLFGFKESERRGTFQFHHYLHSNYEFHSHPLTVSVKLRASYEDSTFEIRDKSSNYLIFRKWATSNTLIIDLIEKREAYYKLSYSYHIRKIIMQFNVIKNHPLDVEGRQFKIYTACKEYQTGSWGGVDKDNTFTSFVNYEYFIMLHNELYIDDYLRSLLQSKTVTTGSYDAYKSASACDEDNYWIEIAEDSVQEFFLSKYNPTAHINYLLSIMN